jgi:ferritin
MIGKKIEDAFNGQLNAELYSGYLYLSMSAYFQSINLEGFAHWMRVQAKEEQAHAMRFFDHIVERMGRVSLGAVEKPPAEWKSPLAAFEDASKHEQKVTGMIHDLLGLAAKESDPAAHAFLQWFVTEQVEEEANADRIVQQLKMIADAPQGLIMLDRALSERQ